LFFSSFENRLFPFKCVHVQRSYTRSGSTRDKLLARESDSNARPAGGMWPGKVVCGPRKFPIHVTCTLLWERMVTMFVIWWTSHA